MLISTIIGRMMSATAVSASCVIGMLRALSVDIHEWVGGIYYSVVNMVASITHGAWRLVGGVG